MEDFLLDDDNRRFEEYAVIDRMYDELVGNHEIDRYSDVSMEKEAETNKDSVYPEADGYYYPQDEL